MVVHMQARCECGCETPPLSTTGNPDAICDLSAVVVMGRKGLSAHDRSCDERAMMPDGIRTSCSMSMRSGMLESPLMDEGRPAIWMPVATRGGSGARSTEDDDAQMVRFKRGR